MKVSELREKIKYREKEELQALVVEMYKLIPKGVKEDKGIDALIDNPTLFKAMHKKAQAEPQNIDFNQLDKEITQFIQYAEAQYYIAPNRIVPKKERSNWRFTAKRLVDQVTTLSSQPEYEKECTALLEKLYVLFCYASGHYVFASEEPFETLKIPQESFFKRVALLKKQTEEPEKWIREMLLLIIDNGLDYVTTSNVLMETLSELLTNAPLKERTVQICKDLIKERKHKLAGAHASKQRNFIYREEEKIEKLIVMIFINQSALGEYEEAVNYYKQHYSAIRDEVKLYILLSLIEKYQGPQNWMKEYDEAVENGTDPRAALKKMYQHIKETNQFPKSPSNFW